jgi:hypothetical protein
MQLVQNYKVNMLQFRTHQVDLYISMWCTLLVYGMELLLEIGYILFSYIKLDSLPLYNHN